MAGTRNNAKAKRPFVGGQQRVPLSHITAKPKEPITTTFLPSRGVERPESSLSEVTDNIGSFIDEYYYFGWSECRASVASSLHHPTQEQQGDTPHSSIHTVDARGEEKEAGDPAKMMTRLPKLEEDWFNTLKLADQQVLWKTCHPPLGPSDTDHGVAEQKAESASSTRATMRMRPSVETDCDAGVWKPAQVAG
jgi:hypothetical protein